MIWLAAMWIAVLAPTAVLIVALRRLDERHGRPGGRSHLDQWHHGYLLLVAAGIVATLSAQQLARRLEHDWPLWLLIAVMVITTLCGIDDARQHWIQRKLYEYRSHLWRFYRWLLLLLAACASSSARPCESPNIVCVPTGRPPAAVSARTP